MVSGEFELRPAEPRDHAAMAAITAAGFATYCSFAPEGWQPWLPTAEETGERFGADGAWAAVAEASGAVVGVGGYVPGRDGRDGALIPGLAHIAAVFVDEAWWGRGVATALLAALVEHMRGAGYREARLYTPVGQARARAFYAREGWREIAGPLPGGELGLDIMELRRPL
jgi:GNAT superfamily N-acetyltransferase